jgi:hypothetical protein
MEANKKMKTTCWSAAANEAARFPIILEMRAADGQALVHTPNQKNEN